MPRFAKYEIERVLGHGGMASVFQARDSRLGHRVALKLLGEDALGHDSVVKRFEREARSAGALSSPHAVRIFDIDQTDEGTPFIVMELLAGRDLADVLDKEGAQPIELSVRWIIEACDAIAEAHRLGIIHRDIKPANLFLCESGSIKVLDFGIAKHIAPGDAALTQAFAPLGTPQYMSPEQIRCASEADPRSDVWSIGVTLFELVTGRPPFDHEVPQACIAAVVADAVPDPRQLRPDLPEALAAVILRALAKDPADRFPSVDALVIALAPFAGAVVQRTPPPLITCPSPPSPAAWLGDAEPLSLLPPPVAGTASPLSGGIRGTRWPLPSWLALPAAAALAIVTVVVAAQAGGPRPGAAAEGAVAPAVSLAAAAPEVAAPPEVIVVEPPTEPEVIELPDAPEPGPARQVRHAPPAPPAPSVFRPAAAKPRPTSGAVRVITVAGPRPAHGGITSPGL